MGRRAAGLRLDRARREAWIEFEASAAGPAEILGFLLHPSLGYVVWQASHDGHAAPEVPFRDLRLSAVEHPADERRLVLCFSEGHRHGRATPEPVLALHVELHTNQWNAVLTRGRQGAIEAVLWPRTAGGRLLRRGAAYRTPEGARRWVDREPDLESWRSVLEGRSRAERRRALLETVAWLSAINVDWVLGAEGDDPAASRARYLHLRHTDPKGAWILVRGNLTQPYPLPLDGEAMECPDLLTAMRVAAIRSGAWAPDDEAGRFAGIPGSGAKVTSEPGLLLQELRRRLRRLRRRRAALERQLEGDDAEALRRIGHLLLARQADIPRGASGVTLDDFEGQAARIDLDPRLDAVGNAERYYDRARRRERAASLLPARLGELSKRIAGIEAAIETVRSGEATGGTWDLVGGRAALLQRGRRASGPSDVPAALPYRVYRSSRGLEIRVGRSARANDDLTFRHAAPEDIWLHARQSPGAHVVLRWGRRGQNPPRADLLEAATLAALHSEARHSSLVAVDWTRRKYVRKPRKSAPGAVVPDRVQTLFVEPDAALAERLSAED